MKIFSNFTRHNLIPILIGVIIVIITDSYKDYLEITFTASLYLVTTAN